LIRDPTNKGIGHAIIVQLDEDDTVYDVVTEEEYRKISRDILKEDRFVIDDDGTGYANALENWEDQEQYSSDEGMSSYLTIPKPIVISFSKAKESMLTKFKNIK
jgi:DNA polymerase alpha subunit A